MQNSFFTKNPSARASDSIELEDEVEESFQRKAFEIREPDENFDPTVAPQDGEEYLTHMLYERKRCATVMVRQPKNCKTGITENVSWINKSEDMPENPFPSTTIQWKAIQITNFLSARQEVTNIRENLHACNYENALEPPLSEDPNDWRDFCINNHPLVSMVLRFNHNTLCQLLDMLHTWLENESPNGVNEEEEGAVGGATSINLAQDQSWIGQWLYAVLCCLYIPLEPDVHYTLREIVRTCIKQRSRLQPNEEEKATPYNLFICIIAKAFDQLDFLEYV